LGIGELPVATALLAQERDRRCGFGQRGPDRRLDLQIDAGRKVAVALGNERTDMSTTLPEDPRTDVDGVFGGEEQPSSSGKIIFCGRAERIGPSRVSSRRFNC
jgi:hypothetical protein